MNAAPFSSCSSAIHSSGWCACSIEPGPQITGPGGADLLAWMASHTWEGHVGEDTRRALLGRREFCRSGFGLAPLFVDGCFASFFRGSSGLGDGRVVLGTVSPEFVAYPFRDPRRLREST